MGRGHVGSATGAGRHGRLRLLGALPARSADVRGVPVSFDGGWIDYYLRRFTRCGVVQGPDETDRLFNGPGLCLSSYAAAVTGRPVADLKATMSRAEMAEWPGTGELKDWQEGSAQAGHHQQNPLPGTEQGEVLYEITRDQWDRLHERPS